MNVPFFTLERQHRPLQASLQGAIQGVLSHQGFIMGPEVAALESALAAQHGVAHGVACASGTDALLLALRALDLQPGDEVIAPSFTFFATAGAIHNAGGTPVFADIDPATFMLTAETIAARWSPRTRAVVVVHLFGQMAQMGPILALAATHGAAVIEDCAQAICAEQRGAGGLLQPGQASHAATLSFFPTKNLGALGDGGMMLTNNPAVAARLRTLRTHGGAKQYHHDEVGYNSRLDTIQAAILQVKLTHLPEWIAARQAHAAAYTAALGDLPQVRPPVTGGGNTHTYHQYTLHVDQRDALVAALRQDGIGTGVYYPTPLHLQPCFRDLPPTPGGLPATEDAARSVVSLPIFPELTVAERTYVIQSVRRFYGRA
jgi:dTDP-4-amino-4,6-dideoxygalactose transaminase